MKKIIFGLALVLFLLPFGALAQTAAGIKVASVNVQHITVQQNRGGYDISFTMTNGPEVQTGLRYGVQLLGENAKTQYVVDEQVYDESITLRENDAVTKQIRYVPPATLSGTYQLAVIVYNSSGFPFAVASAGSIGLTGVEGLVLQPETCILQSGAVKSVAGNTIGVTSASRLLLTCTVKNTGSDAVTAQPTVETRVGSLFGEKTQTSGGVLSPIPFAAGEEKIITVELPKATAPQTYAAKIWLAGRSTNSNQIVVHYAIYGESATIQNLSFDKDSYASGETAQLSLLWGGSVQSAQLSILLSTISGSGCADAVEQVISTKPIIQIPVSITKNCKNPKATVTLKNANGTVLDQKEFAIQNMPASTKQLLIVGIGVLVIGLLGWYMRRKKQHPLTASTVIILLGIGFLALWPTATYADTYASGPNGEIISVVGLPDGTTYGPGSTIRVNARISNTSTTSTYPVNLIVSNNYSPITVIPDTVLNAGESTKLYTYQFVNPNGAPNVPGRYPMKFSTGVDVGFPLSLVFGGPTAAPVTGGTNNTNVYCGATLNKVVSSDTQLIFQYKTQLSTTEWEQCAVTIPAGQSSADNYPGREYFGSSSQNIQVTDECYDESTGIPNSANSGISSC